MLARAQAALERRGDFERRVASAESEGARLRERLDDAEARRFAHNAEWEALARAQQEAEDRLRAAEAELKRLDGAGGPVEREVEGVKDALGEALGDQARLRNLGEALERRRDELQGQRVQLEDEQRALGARLEMNARDREAARIEVQRLLEERDRLGGERDLLLAQRAELAITERRAVEDAEQSRDAVTQLASRAESLRELQACAEGCNRGTASLLSRGDGGQLLADVLRVPAELERAVAAALGVRLQHVVVPSTADALDAIRWLRDGEAGTATALPTDAERRAAVIVSPGRRLVDSLQVDPQYWALVESLLGGVLVADDLDGALGIWRLATHPTTVVTLGGEAIDPLGAVTGGSEPSLEATLLARARELREIEETLDTSRVRLRETSDCLEKVREEIARVGEAVTRVDVMLQAVRVGEVSAAKDRERLEDERIRIAAELELSALEVSGLAGADGEVTGELTALAARTQGAAQRVGDVRALLAVRQQALVAWREQLGRAERMHTELAVQATQETERCRAGGVACEVAAGVVGELGQRLRGVEQMQCEGGEAIEAAAR